MKKIFLTSLFLIILSPLVAEKIVISNYENFLNFSNSRVVYFSIGDNHLYAEPAFNDKEWELVSFPHNWSKKYPDWNGVSWYRLHFILPSELPRRSYAIELGEIQDMDEIYLNGKLIGHSGVFPPKNEHAYDKKRIYELPSQFLKTNADNVIAVRVHGIAGDRQGMFRGNYRFGQYYQLLKKVYFLDLIDIAFLSVYLFFTLYFIIFFMIRPADKANLFFSLFCMSVLTYLFLRTQIKYQLGLNFYLCKKIEYIALGISPLFLLEYMTYFFKRKHFILHYLYYMICASYMLGLVFNGDISNWIILNRYFIQPSWPIVYIYMLVIQSKEAFIRKKRDALYMLISSIILLGFILNDIMVDRDVYNFIRLSNYGFFVMIAGLAIIMSRSFVKTNEKLEDMNVNLELKVERRTSELHEVNNRLAEYNRDISEINEQYHHELLLAAKMQKDFLPEKVENNYWRSAVFFKPTSIISGDFYDFYHLDDESMALVIADASGHGVASALVTMVAKTIFFQNFKKSGRDSLDNLMFQINRELIDEIGEINAFITAIAVRLERDKISIINAAHPAALVKRKDGSISEFHASGTFLGVPNFYSSYHAETVDVQIDDVVLLFTDALLESANHEGEHFGLDRVKNILRDGPSEPANLVKLLTERIYYFTGSLEFRDDLTIIALRRSEL